MVDITSLKHLFSDQESLSCYQEGDIVSIDDIKRRIQLLERQENTHLPDQFYRLAIERDFKNLNSLEHLLSDGLSGIAKKYLDIDNKLIYVKSIKQNDWQQLITYLPPLILKMAFLYKCSPPPSFDKKTLTSYFETFILPNTKYTALPSVLIPELEHYIQKQKGFHDLHIHLNGSTETDLAWQDFLSSPDKVYKLFKSGFKFSLVKEQLEQEAHLFDPLKFYGLLRIARRLRYILYDYIFPSVNSPTYPSLKRLLNKLVFHDRYSSLFSTHFHPFIETIESNDDSSNLMAVEGLMYILILNDLTVRPKSAVGSLFHFYLLIQGLANRLLVQQTHQYGFEQFQKHTLNNLRELSEKEYHQRFFQMHGNDLRNIKFLEGRFSPKKTELETKILLLAILKGWKKLLQKLSDEGLPHPTLKLIAHFIKRKDLKPDAYIRYKMLRIDIWERAKVLSLLIKNYKSYRNLITGVDAAANELDTPPEVFAPTFRMLRKKNIFSHFTYHVGEDYFHLISGLRAIYEAVNFAELNKNDRIGHATAAGIKIALWREVVGETLLIRKGEWLDNLVFVYYYSSTHNIELSIDLNSLAKEIEGIAKDIYDTAISPTVNELIAAWQFRKFCPILIFCDSVAVAMRHSTFDIDEWDAIQNAKITGKCKSLLQNYHEKVTKTRYDKIITLNLNELFSNDDLELLQQALLAELSKKNIVIETLPTSNVRIGPYKDFKDYHLWNWMTWKDDGLPIPDIIIGTDDTGIFATNIFNEFANVFCHLTNVKSQTPDQALNALRAFDNNSHIYSFQ